MIRSALALLVILLSGQAMAQEPGALSPVEAVQAAMAPLLPEGSPTIEMELGPVAGMPRMHREGYSIRSDGESVLLQASTAQGLAAAAARALQLIDDQGRAEEALIVNQPATEWRGLMIDVARFPHTAQDVENAIQLAWLTGLNRVHLHLTDDQLFTFPSEAFPELASWGPEGDRRHFTREELDHLVRFADVRGIQLVPEVDMPAHAGVMVRARPDLFGTTDPSSGESRSTGVVNMANEQAYASLDVLIGEVAEVFWNSNYIHLGADEVYAGHLRELPEYAAYCEKYKLPLAAKGDLGELYCHFVARTCEMVRKRGKRPVVWEGFPGAGTEAAPIPNDILIMAWNLTYQSPESLIKNGFEIVNCGWDPLYVVPSQCWAATLERALDWNVREVRQRLGGREVTLPAEAPVLGAQVCVWEQRPEAILPSSYEVIAAVSSRMWFPGVELTVEEHRADRAGLDRVVRRAFSPKPVPTPPSKPGLQANLKPPVPRYTWAELAPPRVTWAEKVAYDWRAAWPIPLGTGDVLDVDELGVRASGTKPRSTVERARVVNHELFSRVAERGHVDTRIRADEVAGLEWLPRRHWQPMAIELTGQIELPESGEWRFFVRGRDGAAELSLGGAQVATSRGNRQAVGAAELPAGRVDFRVRFHFEYVQNELNLMAQGPGMDAPVPFDELVLVGEARRQGAGMDLSAVEFIDPTQVIVRSLATGKPITSSAGHQGPNIPANAVDGKLGNESGWHCGESPASLTVDLQKEMPLDRAQVYFYHDGGRFYQYRLELSTDGSSWTTVVDASQQTARSTAEGFTHRFAVTPARYVRLVMLKNSANPGVHVNELLVFADAAAPSESGND
ncbi:MAG: hypothetical protein CMJ94_14940 [Planctomycetes bacterium]|nr:hypothetical protein [Planctomycetota bacterium]